MRAGQSPHRPQIHSLDNAYTPKGTTLVLQFNRLYQQKSYS